MKILLHLDRQTSSGCWLTLFLNGEKVGELVTDTQEAKDLCNALRISEREAGGSFSASGDWSGL